MKNSANNNAKNNAKNSDGDTQNGRAAPRQGAATRSADHG